MNRTQTPTRTAALCTLLAITNILISNLYAREYTITVRAKSTLGANASKPAEIAGRLQYWIALSFDHREIESLLRNRPRQISISFPSELPFPKIMILDAFEIFTAGAKSYRGTESGDQETAFQDKWISFRGHFPDDEKSVVVMNFSAAGADAMFLLKGDAYSIRAAGGPQGAEERGYVFYAAAAVKDQTPFQCGTVDTGVSPETSALIQQLKNEHAGLQRIGRRSSMSSPLKHDPPHVANPFGPAVSSDTIEVRVALEGDYELFLVMGSEQAALNLMMSSATYVSAIYLAQTSVKLTVPFIRVWTTAANPYAHVDLFRSLDDFVSYWSQTMSGVDRTVAHLFTNSARWTNISGYVGVAKLRRLFPPRSNAEVRNKGVYSPYQLSNGIQPHAIL